MTRSMYLSRSRRAGMTSRVVRSWMEAFGTEVGVKAVEIVVAIAMKELVDSLPPGGCIKSLGV